MRSAIRIAAFVASILSGLFGVAGQCAAAPCDAMLGWAHQGKLASRQITTADLARLRDIGRSDTGTDQAPAASVAPDGRSLALVVRRADPARNRYCQTLVVIRRDGAGGTLRRIPLEGEPVRLAFDLRGLWMPLGMFAVATPAWSPDGSKVAVLVAHGSEPRAIIAAIRGDQRLTRVTLPRDTFSLGWRSDGRALLYATYPKLSAERSAIADEARSGYHFDGRSWPAASSTPLLTAPARSEVRVRSLLTGADAIATSEEQRRLMPATALPTEASSGALLGDGTIAWIEPALERRWGSPLRIAWRSGAETHVCADNACTGRLVSIWPDEVAGQFLFLRREGWGDSVSVIYRWRPGNRPTAILDTDDLLLGCQIDRGELLCERESSVSPRRLVAMDPVSGASRTLFDPNPEFGALTKPKVTRLHWTADLGVQAFGDLVLPALPHRSLPLIVVGYRTRGFLRGAIGDEYPILPLAARGFAVLSLENTPEYATVIKAPVATYDEAAPVDLKGEADRRLIISSLEAGLKAVAAKVAIDSGRIAITGLSDAASTAWFALINTKLFSLASLSTPTFDPGSAMSTAGPALQAELVRWGYPRFSDVRPDFWKPVSPAINAPTFGAPLLLQYADDEYLMGLDAYTSLKEHHRAVDLYVFPGEHHIKWQPAHRLAVYDRNIDWFLFWFQGAEDPDPGKRRQYARWRSIRDEACHTRPLTGPDIVAPIAAQLCNQASTSTSMVIRR